MSRINNVLRELGYVQAPLWDEHFTNRVGHHLIFYRSQSENVPLTVEVHWQLLSGHSRAHTTFGTWFWSHTEPFMSVPHACTHLHAPTPTAHLLYLVFHQILQHGLFSTRLIWLYDVHRLVEHLGPHVDWTEVIHQTRLLGWEQAFHIVVVLTRTLFDTPWPPQIEATWPPNADYADQLLVQMGTAPGRAEALWREWGELTWWDRCHYVWRKLFPTGEYMRWRYHPPLAWLWPLWYPYRWWRAAQESARLAFTALRHRRPRH
ncbi:MAG: nucleotidyltransferase family protein [Ardenticatenia bacterium]|nr:nucleotidyltransferase family protein [Ardenticatenia bacterium]